jgi:NO-binding membrane sensor protein with MHYT domain
MNSDSMRAMARTFSTPPGSRMLVAASGLLLWMVVGVGVIVAVYAIRNPNGIDFGPWPAAAEVVAVVAALTLGLGVREQSQHANRALAAFGFGAALVALLMLGMVAFVLSFNQL